MFNRTTLDLASVPLAIGYAVGRIGCQISGDGDYGIAWDGPWAMAYPDGAVPTDVAVHPAPIYETLAMGLAAYAIWRMRHVVRPGVMFGAYLVLAGTERLARRVRAPQRGGPGRADHGPALEPGHDRRRRRLPVGARPPRRPARGARPRGRGVPATA